MMLRMWAAGIVCACMASLSSACARTPDWTDPDGHIAVWIPAGWIRQSLPDSDLTLTRFDESKLPIATCSIDITTYPEDPTRATQDHLNGFVRSRTADSFREGLLPGSQLLRFSNSESRDGVLLNDVEYDGTAGAYRAHSWIRQFVVAHSDKSHWFYLTCDTRMPVRGDIGVDIKGMMTSMKITRS